MDMTGAGTTIMLALAAGLWFLYLVPTWIRRREYLETERTATRLQQTIRVLAETSEVPESVRFAVTARDAVRAERLLRAQQRRADAMVTKQVRLERAATPSLPAASRAPLPRPAADAVVRQRMRRTRRIASGLMIAGTVVALVQIWLMATAGVVLGSWLVLGAAFGGVVVAVVTQQRLDARAMPRALRRAAQPARVREAFEPQRTPTVLPAAPAPWTPVPVPQPLYLTRSQVQAPPVASADAGAAAAAAAAAASTAAAAATARLRAAAARDEEAARRAHHEPEVAAMPAPSRFARMGIVDDASTEAPDIDEMLRRRRSAS